MKKVVGIVIGIFLFFTSFQAASAMGITCEMFLLPRDTVAPVETPSIEWPDSIVVSDTLDVTDTMFTTDGIQISDSLISNSIFAPVYLFKPSPKKAVIYSAILPGLGQIYNRKYWKLPIVYGGFVGFTYAITWNNGYYRDYLGAYQDIMDDNPNAIRWHDMLPYGMTPDTVDIPWFTDVLQQRKDYYRYYRDLSIIGTVAWYLLVIVDAYVDAQLFDFDMSTDLSLRVAPAILRDDNARYLASSYYGLQWSFNF